MNTGLQWMFPFANRDRMVERFVEGRMEGSELRAFQKMLGSDPKLQRMVETERAIRGTLLRDRNHIPADDPRGRAHLLAMLATLPTEPVGIAAGTAAQGGSSPGASSAVGTVMKGVGIAATGALLTVGAIFGVRALDESPAMDNVQPAPAQVQSQSTPAAVPQTSQAPRIEQTAPATALPVQTQSAPVEAASSRAAVRSVAQRATVTTNVRETRTRTAVNETPLQVEEVVVPQTQTQMQDQPRRKPVVVLPDTMRVDVMIEMDGEK